MALDASSRSKVAGGLPNQLPFVALKRAFGKHLRAALGHSVSSKSLLSGDIAYGQKIETAGMTGAR
jgi:hypothetical protein